MEDFYCRPTYVVWRSFGKIGEETAEKECLEKTAQNIMSFSVTQRATIMIAPSAE